MPRLFIILSVLALISSAMMPFGYMPALAADGSIVLRICNGTMPADEHESAEHKHHTSTEGQTGMSEHDGSAHEVRCNYAIAATADVPPSPNLAERIEVRWEPAQSCSSPLTSIFPPKLPPATGPPPL